MTHIVSNPAIQNLRFLVHLPKWRVYSAYSKAKERFAKVSNSRNREPFFAIETPFPGAPKATLFRDTWFEHILKRHVELEGQEAAVQTVVSTPSAVIADKSAENVVFVSSSVTSLSGKPLAVVVHREGQFIRTAYYNRSLKDYAPREHVLWLPPQTN